MKRTKSMIYRQTEEARELALYAESIGGNIINPVVDMLAKKHHKGIYDSNKAVDAWYAVINTAAKRYLKDFGYKFDVTQKYSAAVMIEKSMFEYVTE